AVRGAPSGGGDSLPGFRRPRHPPGPAVWPPGSGARAEAAPSAAATAPSGPAACSAGETMARGAVRRPRRRARGAPAAEAPARSAEDWWWDRLAPSGSGYHLLQADSMLLVLPGPAPARTPRRAPRRAPRPPLPRARAAPGPRTAAPPAPAPAPAPAQGPDSGWGDRLPLEILVRIFGLLVAADGPTPFLGRAARVCRLWREAAAQPVLWHTVTLSPPLAGRPAKAGGKAEKQLLASLQWLVPSRLSQLRNLTLIHWKSQVHQVLKLVSEFCPRLSFLKLSDCHGLGPGTLAALARACPGLHSLDIQHSMVESTGVVSFLEEAGPRMCRLWLTYGPQTTAILGALLGHRCPQLQLLEVSAGVSGHSTPLQLPVEALQKGCPHLQVLRLLNLTWLPKPSGRGAPGPGFPCLQELCLASSGCSAVTDEVLDRLLHRSPGLRLLDLRGCARVTPAGLHGLPCAELEQLHLGLYGTGDRLSLAREGSALLTHRWAHSLRELDLSGQGFSEKDLEQALAAFSGARWGSPPALCSLSLRGTRATPEAVSSVISSCPGLLYLNLEACRCLPRGLKRAYRGADAVRGCLQQLLSSRGARVGGLPTPSVGKRFQLWGLGLFCTERHLAKRLKNNTFYPFTQQQPNVFVLEYYLDTLWKGTLLFVVCVFLVSFGLVSQVRGLGPPRPRCPAERAPQLREAPRCPQVQKQETWGFPAYGVGVGLWLLVSSLPRRRLVLNHTRGMYHFSVQGRTVCQGPMHLVYVRLALSSDAYGRCFFQLVLCGHKLEPLVLVQLSERYEVGSPQSETRGRCAPRAAISPAALEPKGAQHAGSAGRRGRCGRRGRTGAGHRGPFLRGIPAPEQQVEFLGRHIARKLNINYFDYLATSYRHVVRHWPLGAAFSPGIVLRKSRAYRPQRISQSHLYL
ncbi:LOW QUALITY PROTEIN: F-box/LRR-repeat protein 6, partial [Galemys pyrenaicus]